MPERDHPDAGHPDPDRAASRRAERSEAAAVHAAAQAQQQARETAQARALVAGFVAEARARGIAPQRLTASSYSGAARYRTGVTGWYLRRNRSVAVGEDGAFYVLVVPDSLRARFRGAQLAPSDPPLIVGKGGRDGDAIDLADLLRLRLDAGADWR